MTVKELKDKLEFANDNLDVMIIQYGVEHDYTSAESAQIKDVNFSSGKLHATDKCFVISDQN